MPDERFALLVNLGKKITDYAVEKDIGGDGEFEKSSFLVCLHFLQFKLSYSLIHHNVSYLHVYNIHQFLAKNFGRYGTPK